MSVPVFDGLPVQVDPSCAAWTDARVTPAEQTRIETAAVSLLWSLSGEQFGVTTATARPRAPWPTKSTVIPSWPGSHFNSSQAQAPWWWGEFQAFTSGIQDYRMVLALTGPVVEIVEIIQDGETVDPDGYTLFGARFLVRTDGKVWHLWQNLAKPATLTVTYRRGKPWPAYAQIVAGTLCCEMAKDFISDPSCKLSKMAKTITREGISIQLPAIQEFIAAGLTGIPEVDRWIRTVNPNGLARSARVYSPDLMTNWRV